MFEFVDASVSMKHEGKKTPKTVPTAVQLADVASPDANAARFVAYVHMAVFV